MSRTNLGDKNKLTVRSTEIQEKNNSNKQRAVVFLVNVL